ncbi:MAG: MBL fold metallo-hydrolase, partial [Deltaproteobacteria bacterium]|nr:MBL fold metallo-hydrolase [Deltaproteobacteria bacterium]
LSNMKKLGKKPAEVDAVVLSHIHGDQTGGLWKFLQVSSGVELYLPKSFPGEFRAKALKMGVKVIEIDRPAEIARGLYSTGEMGAGVIEQALIIKTARGLVVITGCAHPGVVNMVRKAKEVCSGEVYLVLGGFHLMGLSDWEVEKIINELKGLGVKKIGPSHCTGAWPIEMFRQAWREDFLDLGCGAAVLID